MKILRYVFIILLGIALTVVMSFLELPFWLIYLSIVVVYILLLVVPQMYIVYKSNNLARIERYLEENKKKPLFAYTLAVKTDDRDAIIQSINKILKKYKQPFMQEVYKTNLALYENNVSSFVILAKQISKEPLRTYYRAYSEALQGNFEEARTLIGNLPEGWMSHAIEAIIAKENRDAERFREKAESSVTCARGVQKFNLFYAFQHMERDFS
ncbi:hypothetical protein [Psychrobacillus sp. OK032]|uniref:hypothetical protein n=1 Tax=Psychrobacillus sp. OK032 TaxID=1884358 RepID=UPI0008CF8C95|nr:hypothetical protein [Psychrobacillus sp. OK032]SES02252.1 hypothetical protein SAMN05518872_103249 [Psychrobacillus sp. OK032]